MAMDLASKSCEKKDEMVNIVLWNVYVYHILAYCI